MTLGIYIHIPFCVKKCPYCDFTSFTPETLPEEEYLTAVTKEIEARKGEAGGKEVGTIYFGGGTPSLLSPTSVETILRAISNQFEVKDPEISVEANPGTVTLDKLKGYRDAGVNRLSIGVQSLNDRLLKVLGRIHTREEALKAYEAARKAGFKNIGIDLIHSKPGETLSDWGKELEEAVSLRPEHISAYSLTIEEETHFGHLHEKGILTLPPEEAQVDMFQATKEILEKAGYEHYEVSNFALPGFRSRHNQIYWRGGEYLGLGVSAHSYSKIGWGIRRGNTHDLTEYLGLVDEKGTAFVEEEILTKEKAMGEAVFLGLRILEGIKMKEFKERFGVGIEEAFANAVHDLTEKGLLEITQGHLRLTKKGLLLLNEVSVRFV